MPDSFAESADGLVLIANGIDPVLRWDGARPAAEPAGVPAPATAPTLAAASGTVFDPDGNPVPAAGSITGTYVAFVRFVDRDGNVSNLSPASAALVASGAGGVTYSAVAVPTGGRVARRQLLRNTAGQLTTFYIDIDTEDISSTSLTSGRNDAELAARTAVPLLDPDGTDLANRYGVPPDHKPYLSWHIGRMWLAGEAVYAEGSVAVVRGSKTVTGCGTEWPEGFGGRFLYVTAAAKAYEIDTCDPAAQTLTLFDAWDEPSDPYAAYAVRPAPAEANLLYWSEPDLPEAWPAVSALQLPDDGDRVTGLMTRGSFLYVLKSRRCYRVSAQTDPSKDAFVFLAASRGCVNNRCWVVADEVAYLLDEGGVWAFDGGDAGRNVSSPIQTVFRADGSAPRVNWSASRFFHACLHPGQEVVRFYVALAGDYLPRHALAYAYRRDVWWIEEYPFPVGASALGRGGRPSGHWRTDRERVFLGGPAGAVYSLGDGPLDAVPEAAGTLRGTVTAAGVASLTDSRAAFGTLAGTPVAVAEGRGRGQVRVIVSNTAIVLSLDRPWAVKPDATSTYQLGGIAYRYLSGRLRYAPSEDREGRSLELQFEPAVGTVLFTRTEDARATGGVRATTPGVGASSTRGKVGREIDLTDENGGVLLRFDGNRERGTGGPRFVRLSLEGVSADPPVAFGEQVLTGVV